jgi:hypothetical protein
MLSVQNAELFLGELKGRLAEHHATSVKLSSRGAAVILSLAGQEDPEVIAADEEAEFFLPKETLKTLIKEAEQRMPLLRRSHFRIVRT